MTLRPAADVGKGVEQRHEPGVVPGLTGRELYDDRVMPLSTNAWTLVVSPPRERPSP